MSSSVSRRVSLVGMKLHAQLLLIVQLISLSVGSDDVKIRLVDGPTEYEGRVEVYHNGEWGTVCDDGWDLNDAQVVCNELGVGRAIDAKRRAYYGKGSGNIWLDNVNCTGGELTIRNCSHRGWGIHNCRHNKDAGVQCSSVRLADGLTNHEGRVEVYHNGEWGTVCDDGWDLNDALVVCGELGLGPGITARHNASYGQGDGRIWLDNLNCTGNEWTIRMCSHRGWAETKCSHSNDAGVQCGALVRLAESSFTKYTGSVEVYHNGIWGSVCYDGWDFNDAQVVCREMNYGNAIAVRYQSYFDERRRRRRWLDDVNCVGTEWTIGNCLHKGWGVSSCKYFDVAGVTCATVRLVNGPTEYEGRVEVHYNGEWGTVCDDGWDLNDAQVVCNELGFGLAVVARHNASYGEGSGRIWIGHLNCVGTEESIRKCSHRGWGNETCSHSKDAGVKCNRVRLVDGSSKYEGRVEVHHNGEWGTVCDDGWDLNDAQVVCNELELDGAAVVRVNGFYGEGSRKIWLDDLNCVGTEWTIGNCSHRGWNVHNCEHKQDAGVQCVKVRLVNGPTSYEGRVEVYHNGEWGTVCDDGWDLNDAQVVCSELGLGPAIRHNTSYGQGAGQIWLHNLTCVGNELTIRNCSHGGWGVKNYSHSRDAGVQCSVPVRLVDGATKYEGRVEVYHNGEWGVLYDRKWGLKNGRVVCKELGFGNVAAVSTVSFYEGGLTWIVRLKCKGVERTIRNCSHTGWIRPARNHHIYIADHLKCLSGTIRLVDGPTTYEGRLVDRPTIFEGRVEVYHNGEWGTVCDDGWDLNDAQVVCNELSLGNALAARHNAFYGEGNGQIWLGNINCDGNESFIENCSHGGWGIQNCSHSNDAGVKCVPVRLLGGPTKKEGRVEVYRRSIWGTVCANSWDLSDAQVVCKELGYGIAITATSGRLYGIGSNSIRLNGVRCDGTEWSIGNCSHRGWRRYCNHRVAGVKCASVRLVNGPTEYEGRVEVYHNGEWGTVCDEGWNLTHAQVVCRELGYYSNITAAISGAFYGQGFDKKIWLVDINCAGTESTIVDCLHEDSLVHHCDHRRDAGVKCTTD